MAHLFLVAFFSKAEGADGITYIVEITCPHDIMETFFTQKLEITLKKIFRMLIPMLATLVVIIPEINRERC